VNFLASDDPLVAIDQLQRWQPWSPGSKAPWQQHDHRLAIIDAAAESDLAIAGADGDTVAGRRVIAEAFRRYR
jgi:hypothetical protein